MKLWKCHHNVHSIDWDGIELRIKYMLRSVLIKIVYFKQEFKFKFKNQIYNHVLHISGKYTSSVFFL